MTLNDFELSLIRTKKGGITIKRNNGKKENRKYKELKKVVNSSGNSAATRQLNLLFEETNWSIEPYELIKLVKSSRNEQALEQLVLLFSTKYAMCNHHASLLQDIVESKISSKEGDLKETSRMIQQAIHNQFWRLPS